MARPSADPRLRILFLAANPDSTTPLHAGREVRRIREKLALTEHRSAVEIVERWAVRPGDLQHALLEVEPQIVHFSGHGSTDYELMLEGDDGSPHPVGKEVLGEIFRLRGEGVRLVLLCACHSLPQAEAIAEHVECAIGMRRAFGSEAASEFSSAFYRAIGAGDSIRKAFESARLHLQVTGVPEHRTPHLVVRREGVDLDRPLLAGEVYVEPGQTHAPVSAPAPAIEGPTAEHPASKGAPPHKPTSTWMRAGLVAGAVAAMGAIGFSIARSPSGRPVDGGVASTSTAVGSAESTARPPVATPASDSKTADTGSEPTADIAAPRPASTGAPAAATAAAAPPGTSPPRGTTAPIALPVSSSVRTPKGASAARGTAPPPSPAKPRYPGVL